MADFLNLLDMCGKAFSLGIVSELAPHLADDCVYHSDYSGKDVSGKEDILAHLRTIYSNLTEECSYSYEIAATSDAVQDAKEFRAWLYGRNCLRLFQGEKFAALVFLSVNEQEKITSIHLSDGKNLISHVQFDTDSMNTSEHYVWEQSDKFVREWLPKQGYSIKFSRIQENCTGYRCLRKGEHYTIFVFAFGKKKTTQLDGDYCARLVKLPYAENSTVLVLYLHVEEIAKEDGTFDYEVQDYSGKPVTTDFWRVTTVQDRNILDYFPRKEVNDMVFRFIAAFNNKSLDVFEAILAPNVYIDLIEKGRVLNDGVYGQFTYLFKNFGKMKLAYLRKNDVIFASVPYLEGFGYFSFTVRQADDKIDSIKEYPLDGKYEELWVTDVSIDDFSDNVFPTITAINTLPSEVTQRFALKLTFDNGEVKKYILPTKATNESDEVVMHKGCSFTDKIWRNARLVASSQKKSGFTNGGFTNYGQGVDFINGFSIGTIQLYQDSIPFYEPTICDALVFENEDIKIVKIAEWSRCSLYFAGLDLDNDNTSDKIKVLLPGGDSFNWNGISTFANTDGTRATNLDFCFMGSFQNGLISVGVTGFGYGFMNNDMSFVIPPKYSHATNFSKGYAVAVTAESDNVILDTTGREIRFDKENDDKKYKNICDCSDGMFRVSLMEKMGVLHGNYRLAYHHDDESYGGLWGFVDTNGVEVIPPQYIFAYDFIDGIALVCKGKWEYKDQWDERENTQGWWSVEMLWGFIDKQGNEVVACEFDEIQFFQNDNSDKYERQYFKAHIGGWSNGKWGVIDRKGDWLVEPIFEDVDYTISDDGCFAFYEADRWSTDNVPMGIFSLFENRVLFSPQFFDIDYLDDGCFEVEIYDETLGKNIKNIIDREGNQMFESEYSYIHQLGEFYVVTVYEDINGERHSRDGLINKNGEIILPCKYDAEWNGISYERKQIICKDEANGKYKMIDFEENIIIPAIYDGLSRIYKTDFLSATIGEKDNQHKGLLLQDGTEVLPIIFDRISIHENIVIAHNEKGSSIYKIMQYELGS